MGEMEVGVAFSNGCPGISDEVIFVREMRGERLG